MSMIQQLREKVIQANDAYRIGKPIISDSIYDKLIDELSKLSPDDEVLAKVGHTISDDRKTRLPIKMASMDKTKSIEDLKNWFRLRNIKSDELIIITPKFDGLSLCVNELNNYAYTRGDGEFGQKSNDHYKLISNKFTHADSPFNFTYGEVMLPKKIFLDKYSSEFANPRNLVAGLLNSKDVNESLKDTQYIKYGAVPSKGTKFNTKQEILDKLNEGQSNKVNYKLISFSDINEDLLISLFHEWSDTYEIDGVILEINNLSTQESLGRERSGNPVWARAFKHPSFEQSAESEVIGISWNISKQGYLKPIIHINPIKLDGVTVSNVTGNNARFIKDSGIGIGAKVIVKRSGMVIPLIVSVTKKVDFAMPNIPNIDWNENGIELITLSETDDQKLKQLISFFEILEAKNVGEGVISQIWEAGYTSLKDILSLTVSDLEKIDRFGKRKATIVYNSINKSITNISLSKLQHATGIFNGLGSKKLILLEHFIQKPTINDVIQIEGFAEKSAQIYIDNYDRFFEFIKDLPIKLVSKKESTKSSSNSSDLEGKTFVFTGVRLPEYEKIIIDNGGKVGSTISKNTSYLVIKSIGSGSSKEKKAIDLGINILEIKDLEDIIYTIKK